jgi:UPF0042 nucleotide-binding protein
LSARYKETRRRHPLDVDGIDLSGAVRKEKEADGACAQQGELHHRHLGAHPRIAAAQACEDFYGGQEDQSMHITVESFGYKYGIPIEADL